MADITIEIVIPEAHQERMKAAIEYYVAQGSGDIPPNVTLDEDGKLSASETVDVFKRMTYRFWRGRVIRAERDMADSVPDDIFDPNTIP